MFNYHSIWRGLQTVSYDRDEYRATVKNDNRETVLVSVNVLSMRNAIRESNDLASHYAESQRPRDLLQEQASRWLIENAPQIAEAIKAVRS